VQLLREATAKMTGEKSEMKLRAAEQSAAITCLNAELKVAKDDLQRAQKDTSRAATAAADAAAAKLAVEADLAAVRAVADAAGADVLRLEDVLGGLQKDLLAAQAASQKASGEVSVHLGNLKAAEGRCQQLQDSLAQQVGMVSCAQHCTSPSLWCIICSAQRSAQPGSCTCWATPVTPSRTSCTRL
jgi:chromosome segregation ATPase